LSFGKQSGPPASDKQVSYLLSLVEQAGHDGFRDARHPLGLTQRQAAGKFTVGEASALIDQLLNGEPAADAATPATTRLDEQRADVVRGLPADILAAELERRGWQVGPPPGAS
jgi:hypothetical protein